VSRTGCEVFGGKLSWVVAVGSCIEEWAEAVSGGMMIGGDRVAGRERVRELMGRSLRRRASVCDATGVSEIINSQEKRWRR